MAAMAVVSALVTAMSLKVANVESVWDYCIVCNTDKALVHYETFITMIISMKSKSSGIWVIWGQKLGHQLRSEEKLATTL